MCIRQGKIVATQNFSKLIVDCGKEGYIIAHIKRDSEISIAQEFCVKYPHLLIGKIAQINLISKRVHYVSAEGANNQKKFYTGGVECTPDLL